MTGLPTSRNYYRRRPKGVWHRVPVWLLWILSVVVIGLLLGGCSTGNNRGLIKVPGAAVKGVSNAGTPATLSTSNAGTTIPLPAGSVVTVTKEEAVPPVAPTPAGPLGPAQAGQAARPAKETTVITPASATEYRHTEASIRADTGTVDTSVAIHAQNVAERRWLLWVAIGCGVGGIVVRSMLPAWPSLSNGLLLAAVVAGVSWKLADIPSWIWLVGLVVAGAMAMGYKRAELDKDGDGIPDFLQKKP